MTDFLALHRLRPVDSARPGPASARGCGADPAGRRAHRQADGAGRHHARVRPLGRTLVGVRSSAGGMQLVSNAPWIPGLGHQLPGRDRRHLAVHGAAHHGHDAAQRAGELAATSPTGSAAFYALMLTLLTGLVGVFIALDLFVFYVFFEIMLIPMYFIIGIWGGANRLYAAIKFFIYTMAGSLLMLVAIVVMVWKIAERHRAPSRSAYEHLLAERRHRRRRRRPGSSRPSRSPSPSRCRSSRSTPGCPTPTSRRPPPAACCWPRSCSRSGPTAFSASRCRSSPRSRCQPGGQPPDGGAGGHRHHLRRAGRDGAAGHQEAGGLLLGEPPRLRDAGHLGRHRASACRAR